MNEIYEVETHYIFPNYNKKQKIKTFKVVRRVGEDEILNVYNVPLEEVNNILDALFCYNG